MHYHRLGPVGDNEYVQYLMARHAANDNDSPLPDFLLDGEDGADSNEPGQGSRSAPGEDPVSKTSESASADK